MVRVILAISTFCVALDVLLISVSLWQYQKAFDELSQDAWIKKDLDLPKNLLLTCLVLYSLALPFIMACNCINKAKYVNILYIIHYFINIITFTLSIILILTFIDMRSVYSNAAHNDFITITVILFSTSFFFNVCALFSGIFMLMRKEDKYSFNEEFMR